MKAFTDFFWYYFHLRGRTGRKGFWLFFLINIIITFILQLVDRYLAVSVFGFSAQEVSELNGIYLLTVSYLLGTLIPNITLAIRRLHDVGKSGWWLLISFVPVIGNLILLYFACLKSDEDNQFGARPPDGYTSIPG